MATIGWTSGSVPIQARRPGAGEERLIIFARAPEPGRAKTRLIPALGPEGAAELQRQMTRRTLAVARECARSRGVSVEVRHAGGSPREMANLYGRDGRYIAQGAGDLGARMEAAAGEALGDGARSVVIIGTDCPGLEPLTVDAAFTHLGAADLVLGPAADGGYYLVGLRAPARPVFRGIEWGTGRVLRQTLGAARRLGLRTAMLHRLRDVDEPRDLVVWERAARRPLAGIRLSVVIPALNEEAGIGATVEAARAGAWGGDVEVIVCDGGSSDGTAEVARGHSAAVVAGASGRGRQLNAGVRAAAGDLLLFLHADTILPPAYDVWVRRRLADPRIGAGAFRLRTDSARLGMRLVEMGANLRARLLSMPYGDQAIFLRRSAFDSIGGFPEVRAMEDFELVRRLRRVGRIAIVPSAVRTSARRWLHNGIIRTTIQNQLCAGAYLAGVSADRIAGWQNPASR